MTYEHSIQVEDDIIEQNDEILKIKPVVQETTGILSVGSSARQKRLVALDIMRGKFH